MNIVVTGGAGFIGSHVVRALLQQGHAVTVIDNFDDFYDPAIKESNLAAVRKEIEVAIIDLRDEEATYKIIKQAKPEAIIHLAARAGVRPSILNPKLYLENNITGTFHVLEAARLASCERVLFASSSSVYGLASKSLSKFAYADEVQDASGAQNHSVHEVLADSSTGATKQFAAEVEFRERFVPFNENLPLLQTLSPYAATKLAGEQLCGNFSYLYGMRTIGLRFFTVYGPSQRPDLAIHRFTDAITRGLPIKQFGDGSTRRDYTYIDDIVQGILGAMSYNGPLFDLFNLGENETTTLSALIASIENAVGRKAIIEQFPEQPGDMPLTCADISKARKLLNYHPTIPIAVGIPKFVEWYNNNQARG